MPVKEFRVPGTGVLRAMLIVLSAALVAASLAACDNAPWHVPENESDRAALVAFYQSTNGPDWKNKSNWLSNRRLGAWHGVTTDGSGRVIHLELPQNRLTGQIPPELGNLNNLLLLNLSWNRLSGPIPPELGNLNSLESVYFHGNGLNGPVPPELGNLLNLTKLSLYANRLSGPVPPELGRLVNLRRLYLDGNLLSGQLPPELGNLANLTGLSLSSNRLSRQVPPDLLGKLENLTWLTLDQNELTGCVPSSFRGSLTSSLVRGLPFCDEVSPPAVLRPCTVGMRLEAGDYCTFDTSPPDSNWPLAWPYRLYAAVHTPSVYGQGKTCLGSTPNCFFDRIDREWLSASVNPDGSWTVHRVP